MDRAIPDLLPLEANAAAVRPIDAIDDIEKRRLAGPVGPDHPLNFSLPNVKLDAIEDNQAAEALPEVADLQQAHRCSTRSRKRSCGVATRRAPPKRTCPIVYS